MTALDHIRFRYAFSQRRREALKTAAALLAIFTGYAIVGTLDYAEEQRQEAQHHSATASAITSTLADCLNGTARFTHSGPHADGYGKTGIVCLPAQEYRL